MQSIATDHFVISDAVRFIPLTQEVRDAIREIEDEFERVQRGYRDGRTLVFGMAMLERLPNCFVPVPDLPTEIASAGD